MFDYGRSAETAQRLINRFGRQVTLQPPSTVSSDPSRPWAPPVKAQPLTPKAVITDFDKRLIASGTVQAKDKRVVVASLDLGGATISDDWALSDGGQRYRIIEVDEKKPGDTSLVFILQVRA